MAVTLGGVAVHGEREVAHRSRRVGIDREQGAQAGLGDSQLRCDLGPAPPLVQNQLHQQAPR